jgi:acetyl-CoA carboxylase biotin carboxyl carrier protein
MGVDISRIAAIVKMLAGTRISELEIQEEGFHVKIRRQPTLPAAPAPSQVPEETPAQEEQPVYITSPVVGVFRKPSEPLNEGDKVEAGQVVGVVESMRLANPVRAAAPGTLVRYLVQDGDPVEYGQNLVELAPETNHHAEPI